MLQILLTLIIGGLVFVVTRVLYWYFTKARRIIQMTDHLKAPARHFLWGSLHLHPGMNEKQLKWYRDMNAKFGDVFKLWRGPFDPQVIVCHPELAKQLLRIAQPKDLSVYNYGMLKSWLGNGIIVSDGKLWQRNRHLLTPAFHFSMLKMHVEVMHKTTNVLIGVLEKYAISGESFDVFDAASLFTLDNVLRCVFSFEDNIQVDRNNRIVQLQEEAIAMYFYRMLRPYLWPDFIFDRTSPGEKFRCIVSEYSRFNQNIIQKRKAELKKPREQYEVRDFLDIMLLASDENGDGMSDQEIEAEVKNVLAAAHETTSSALSWTLYSLAKHPEHQDRCREEVREILEGRTADELGHGDLQRLEYLTMVIKETMRLYTVIPLIAREITQDLQIGEHILPKGCSVQISIDAIHHHPEIWDNPDSFDPTRFSSESTSGHGVYDFIPFSAGPRNCIGQHFAMNVLKIAAAKILHRFEIGYDANRPVVLSPGITLKAEGGLWLTLKHRNTEEY